MHIAWEAGNPYYMIRVSCFITSLVSGQGNRIGPSVCLSVCPSISTLTTEPFDIQTRNLTCRSACTISRSSLMVKVIGQRSRGENVILVQFYWLFPDLKGMIQNTIQNPGLSCDVRTSCDVTNWCQFCKRTLEMPNVGGAFSLTLRIPQSEPPYIMQTYLLRSSDVIL